MLPLHTSPGISYQWLSEITKTTQTHMHALTLTMLSSSFNPASINPASVIMTGGVFQYTVCQTPFGGLH